MKNLSISVLGDKVAIKLYVFLCFLMQSLSASSQEINRVAEIWSNGNKKQVEYLNEDLEIVRVEYFDPKGHKSAMYNFNPKTGNRNGTFFDGENKGYYEEGLLTANGYTFFIDDNGYYGRGDRMVEIQSIERGVIKGEVKFFIVNTEKLNKTLSSQRFYVDYIKGDDIGRYASLFGFPEQYQYSKLFYDENGFLHGKFYINEFTTLLYNHGELEGVLTYVGQGIGQNVFDQKGNFVRVDGIAKDSIFRDAKIWKRDFKFHKNYGLIDDFRNPHIYNLTPKYEVLWSSYEHILPDSRDGYFYSGEKDYPGYGGDLWLFHSDKTVYNYTFENPFLIQESVPIFSKEGIIFKVELPAIYRDYSTSLIRGTGGQEGWTAPKEYERRFESHMLNILKWNIEFWIGRYGINVLTTPDFFSETFKYNGEKNDYLNFNGSYKERFYSDYMFPCCHSAFDFIEKRGGIEEHESSSFLEIHEILSSLTKFEFLLKMKEFTKKSSSDFYAKIHFVNTDNYVPSANSLVDFSNLINHTQEKYKIFQDNRAKRISEIHNEFKITGKDLEKALHSEDWSSARIYYKKMLDIQKINHNEGLRIVFDIPTYAFVASFDDIPNYINLKEKNQKILAEYNKFLMNVSEVSNKNNILLDTTKLRFSKEDFLSNKIGFSEQTFESFTVNLLKVIEYIPKLINTYFKIDGRYHLSLNFNAQKRRLEFQFQVKIIKVENDFLFTKKDLKNAMKTDSTMRLLFFSDKLEEGVFHFGDLKRTFRIDANN